MKEYRTERVSPESESQKIMYYEAFGWVLENTQEVYHESEKLVRANTQNTEFRGLETTFDTKTEVTNYVTLRFSRDLQMPHYARLVELQNKFEGLKKPQKTKCNVKVHEQPIGWTVLSCIAVLAVIALIILTVTVDSSLRFVLIIVALVAISPIVVTIVGWLEYKKYYYSDLEKILSHQMQYESMVELYDKRQKEIFNEAIRLSSQKIRKR